VLRLIAGGGEAEKEPRPGVMNQEPATRNRPGLEKEWVGRGEVPGGGVWGGVGIKRPSLAERMR
jgi:hypothetical protein